MREAVRARANGVKEFFQKEKTKKVVNKVEAILMTAGMCAGMIGSVGFCAPAGADDVVPKLLGQLCKMFSYVGIVVCVIGVAKFALAMKDENPDGQTRAVYYAIAGAILIGIRVIVTNMGFSVEGGE